MDTPSELDDSQITSPTGAQNPEDIRPGGDPFTSTDDTETIDISFVNEDFDLADVTEFTISRGPDGSDTGVKEVQVWYKPEGSDTYVPYAPSDSEATDADVIPVTDDAPIVLVGLDKVTDIRIIVVKDDDADDMSFDVKVHACLHPGKNPTEYWTSFLPEVPK